eukprot:3369558-Karenia_brevis.AAC.1
MEFQRVPRLCQFGLKSLRRLRTLKRWVTAHMSCLSGYDAEAMLARGGASTGLQPGYRSSFLKTRQ